MRLIALVSICGLLSVVQHAKATESADTLRLFDVRNGVATYESRTLAAFAARFTARADVRLDGVRFWVRSSPGARARVRVFGSEGDGCVPTIENALHEPVWIGSNNRHMDTLTITFDQPIDLIEGQFFICVDSLDGMSLLTDRVTVQPECVCSTDRFVNQCLKTRDGEWKTGEFSFLVEPIIEVEEHVTPIQFVSDTILNVREQRAEKFGILASDFNGDGHVDLVVGNEIAFGPIKSGNSARNRSDLKELHPSMTDVELLSTLQGDAVCPSIVGINTGSMLNIEQWKSRGISGLSVTIPLQGEPMFSLAVRPIATTDEVLVIGERSPSPYGSASVYASEPGLRDRLIFIHNALSSPKMTTLHVPLDEYLQAANAFDFDHDGDLDLLVVTTQKGGRVAAYTSEYSHSDFHALQSLGVSADPPVERPIVSLLQNDKVHNRQQRLSEGVAAITLAVDSREINHETQITPISILPINEHDLSVRVGYHDRISAISSVDVDADGTSEFIVTSSDTCRKIMVYAKNEQGALRRVFGTGIDALTGSVDLAWVDLDNDGLDDAVGLVNGRLIVAWNRSTSNVFEGKRHVIPHKWTEDVTIAEVQSSAESQVYRSVWGGSHNVHVRTAPAIRSNHESDTVTLLRRHVGGDETIHHLVLLPTTDVKESNEGCIVHVTPNPFTNMLHIKVDAADAPVSCSVLDGAGVVVWKLDGFANTTEQLWDGCSADGRPLASGVYTLLVSTGTCQITRRVVKVH